MTTPRSRRVTHCCNRRHLYATTQREKRSGTRARERVSYSSWGAHQLPNVWRHCPIHNFPPEDLYTLHAYGLILLGPCGDEERFHPWGNRATELATKPSQTLLLCGLSALLSPALILQKLAPPPAVTHTHTLHPLPKLPPKHPPTPRATPANTRVPPPPALRQVPLPVPAPAPPAARYSALVRGGRGMSRCVCPPSSRCPRPPPLPPQPTFRTRFLRMLSTANTCSPMADSSMQRAGQRRWRRTPAAPRPGDGRGGEEGSSRLAARRRAGGAASRGGGGGGARRRPLPAGGRYPPLPLTRPLARGRAPSPPPGPALEPAQCFPRRARGGGRGGGGVVGGAPLGREPPEAPLPPPLRFSPRSPPPPLPPHLASPLPSPGARLPLAPRFPHGKGPSVSNSAGGGVGWVALRGRAARRRHGL